MEHSAEIALGRWTAPQCPFEIEYSARVLDDIRLAVVDAYFSVPRGGAEIGGILLGKWEGDRISITGFEALACEHASGPSFTLSARDQAQLAEMIGAAWSNTPDRQPVGWYHSHTRSEIFLSETDRAIHNRFFPEPWQVALVLKPHTFEPTRAGFFFREPGGAMHSEASYQEFRLDAMPLRPNGVAGLGNAPHQRPAREDVPPQAPEPAQSTDPPKPKGRVPITREIPIEVPPVNGADGQEKESTALPAPDFGQLRPHRSWRVFKAAAILGIGLAAGGAGYQTRQYWLPQVLTKLRAALPHEPNPYLSLAVSDDNGQLRIRWDRNSPAVRNALDATLEIADGNTVPQTVRLDRAHLASGGFTYGRQMERVDVTLIAAEPGGKMVKEQTSFLGQLPLKPAGTADPQEAKDRDAAAEKADKLQKDLDFQAAKTRKLEKDLKDMREQLEKSKPAPDAGKKN